MHRPLIAVLALVSHATAQQLPSPPRLVVDFDARPRTSLSSSPREYCAVAGMSYFVATDGLGVPGLYRSFGTGAITTLNAYGNCYPESSGTITTCNHYGLLDLSGDRTARTISTLNRYPGSVLKLPVSGITLTTVTYNGPGEYKTIYV